MREYEIVKRTHFFKKSFNALLTFDEWRRQNYPGRAPEDVKTIFEECCSQCPLYNPERRALPTLPKGVCDDGRSADGVVGCGCHVSPDAGEWSNSLAIPSKPCPRGLFLQLVKPDES